MLYILLCLILSIILARLDQSQKNNACSLFLKKLLKGIFYDRLVLYWKMNDIDYMIPDC